MVPLFFIDIKIYMRISSSTHCLFLQIDLEKRHVMFFCRGSSPLLYYVFPYRLFHSSVYPASSISAICFILLIIILISLLVETCKSRLNLTASLIFSLVHTTFFNMAWLYTILTWFRD